MDGVRTGEGGVRELQGDGLGSIGVDGRSRTLFSRRTGPLWPPARAGDARDGERIRSRELSRTGMTRV